MEENTSTNTIHIYDVVMRAVSKLPDVEKETLMNQLTIQQLTNLLVSQDNMNAYIQSIIDTINVYNSLTSALTKVCNALNGCIDGVDDIVCDYDKLGADKKKEAALKLLNNAEFQKNCCEIMVSDMERIAKTDVNVKAINDVFNITGWCKNLIKRGIGMNHKYEV